MSIKDSDVLLHGAPAQWLPENQDPSVAFVVDEVTGETSDLPGYVAPSEEKPAKASKKKAPVVDEEEKLADMEAEMDRLVAEESAPEAPVEE